MMTTSRPVTQCETAEEYKYSVVEVLYIEDKDDKGKSITALPSDLYRYKNLHTIVCQHNKIKNVDVLQYLPHLKRLYFKDMMKITSLDCLPPRLEILQCIGTSIESLNNLPNTLQTLHCFANEKLSSISVPDSLYNFASDSVIDGEEVTLENIRSAQTSTYVFK